MVDKLSYFHVVYVKRLEKGWIKWYPFCTPNITLITFTNPPKTLFEEVFLQANYSSAMRTSIHSIFATQEVEGK